MSVSNRLIWPVRKLALRLYRPYIELAEAAGGWATGEPRRGDERAGLADTRKTRSLALGSLLREYREFAGYSRSAFGERLGISADQLERWEIVGVPVPVSERFLALADLLDVPESAVGAAVAEGPDRAAHVMRRLPRDPVDQYEAAPVLEHAIVFHGWTPEEVAEALATSPTKVQAWRLGAIEMTQAERLALAGLVRVRSERAGE